MRSLLRFLFCRGALGFLFEIHRIFSRDPSYSLLKGIMLGLHVLKNEKIIPYEGSLVISSFLPPLPSKALLTVIRAGRDKRQPFASLVELERSAPLSIYLSVTDRCSYDCVYCSAKFAEQSEEKTTGQWIELVSKLQAMGTANIGFTGGEPLLRGDMEKIIGSVSDSSTTVLFTNGHRLTLERARSLKESGLMALSVSLDSHDPATHNRLRRNERAFEEARRAIENASRAGLYTIVQAVIIRQELVRSKVLALCRLVEQLGAHEIRIHQPAPSGRLLGTMGESDIFYTEADREKLFSFQRLANRQSSSRFKVTSFPYTEGPRKYGCTAGLFHSYVSTSGELFPCDFIPISFGNVFAGDVQQQWRKMADTILRPRERCWAMAIGDGLADETLPLSPEKAVAFCTERRSQSFPAVYRRFHG